MFDAKAFGKRLSEKRKESGFRSADDLAKAAGDQFSTRSSIAKWESGKQIKGLTLLARSSEILGVSVDWLMFEADDTQLDIYRDIGLTDPAITALRKLKAEDTSGKIMEALNRVLSNPNILNTLATFIDIVPGEPGHYSATDSIHSPEGFYLVTMSPDDYAQNVLMCLNQKLEELRTGKPKQEYPPITRQRGQAVKEITAQPDKVWVIGEEGSEDNAEARK